MYPRQVCALAASIDSIKQQLSEELKDLNRGIFGVAVSDDPWGLRSLLV